MHWFDGKEGDPNEAEMLFLAFLIARSPLPVAEQHSWAQNVLREKAQAEEQRALWKAPTDGVWCKKNGVSTLFAPMEKAYRHTSWPHEVLDEIGASMSLWEGPGRHDDPRWSPLLNHLRQEKGVKINKKDKTGPPRWRTWAIVRVAELVYRHGQGCGSHRCSAPWQVRGSSARVPPLPD